MRPYGWHKKVTHDDHPKNLKSKARAEGRRDANQEPPSEDTQLDERDHGPDCVICHPRREDMTREQKTELAIKHLGFMGKMLSQSKSSYQQKWPERTVFFNGNLYDQTGEKLWYGDLDVVRVQEELAELAKELGGPIYATREMPYRFEEVTVERLERDCLKTDHPNCIRISP